MTNQKLPAARGNGFRLPQFLERRRESVSFCREFGNIYRQLVNSRRDFVSGCREIATFCRVLGRCSTANFPAIAAISIFCRRDIYTVAIHFDEQPSTKNDQLPTNMNHRPGQRRVMK
jgi:hypothetical protein